MALLAFGVPAPLPSQAPPFAVTSASARPLPGHDQLFLLTRATAGLVGRDFLRALVRALGEGLGLGEVLLGAVAGERIAPLAAWRAGGLVEDAGGLLADAHCSEVVATGVCVRRCAPACVGVPVRRGGGEVRGVLRASGAAAFVAALDVEVLGLFAERAAAEMDRLATESVLGASVEARRRHQSALLALAQLSAPSFESALGAILTVSAQALGVERASYWSLVDGGEAILCERQYVLTTGDLTSGARLAATTYPAYFAALCTCQTIDASDARVDPRTAEFNAGYFDVFGIGAMLDVPVWLGKPFNAEGLRRAVASLL